MPSREEKKAATRKRLLDAAAAVVAKQGAMAASLDAIAERAGLTKGAVYSNFDSKLDLLIELHEHVPGPQVGNDLTVDRPVADQIAEFGDQIPAAIRSVSKRAWDLTLELFHFAQRDARFRKVYAAAVRENDERVGAMLEEVAAARGEPLPMPGAQLALVLNAMAIGLAQHRNIDPQSVPDDLFARVYRLLAG
ncbi:MAG TPA: TetR/AcrR family transcriptional regulator [Acidimicrobiales bacterium]|nr:TetR/AcrR family transcriptional regulator [Acidimicrobiales bacterium]